MSLLEVCFRAVRPEVHVTEAVYREDGQIIGRLSQVVEGMRELQAIRRQEINRFCGREKKRERNHTKSPRKTMEYIQKISKKSSMDGCL